ncbi:MAG: hypothetical protein H0U10_00190 [Chloroflexia bacterium]|nr:hypothetical protein [Chloroflexia bacterium]
MNDPPSNLGRLLAGPHNARLGPAIHAFNLPAEPDVCIGASPTCEAACYAKGFLFRIQLARHRRNHEWSRDDRFVRSMVGEIRRGLVRVVRIHTSGDFDQPDYVRSWAEVARACPGTAFFSYTRSWRVGPVLAELIGLARLANVSLWFSEDRDSGRPPAVPRVRRAYLLADGEAEDGVPTDADLVFRVPLPRRPGQCNQYARPAKRANGILVCPKEQGIARRVELTCSSCRICFTDRARRFGTP